VLAGHVERIPRHDRRRCPVRIKRTLTEVYAAVDDQGREGLFPIAVVFASEDGERINVFTAEHIGPPGELLRDLAAGDWEHDPRLDPPRAC
jgi:hypothetical protein